MRNRNMRARDWPLCSPLQAQEGSTEQSEKIDNDAMKALNDMGTYLRSLKDFQVQAAVTNEDVLSDGEKLQFANTTNILAAPQSASRRP